MARRMPNYAVGRCMDCLHEYLQTRSNQCRCPTCHEESRLSKALCGELVAKLVRARALPKLRHVRLKCRDCRKRAKFYDHRDYDFPAAVEPVCISCNVRRGLARRTVFTDLHAGISSVHPYVHKNGAKAKGEQP